MNFKYHSTKYLSRNQKYIFVTFSSTTPIRLLLPVSDIHYTLFQF